MLPMLAGSVGGSLLGGLFGGGAEEAAMNERKKAQALYEGLLTPEFAKYNPELYQETQAFTPEMMEAMTVSEDPALRERQMEALSRLSGLAETGLSDVDEAGFRRAEMDAGRMARGSRDALRTNAAARGMAGSGLDFMLQEQANQEAAQRAMQGGLDTAANAAKMRAQYQTAYGDALANVRGQDYNVNRGNTDILNQFNQMNTQARNQATNQALQNRQNISSQNVDLKNDAQKYANQMKQQDYSNRLSKINGQAGMSQQMAQAYDQDAAASQARWSNIGGLAGGVAGSAFGGGSSGGASAGGYAGIADSLKRPNFLG